MKRRIRLLCCIHDLRGRGAEKVLSILMEKFDRDKFQIGLFLYHNNFTVKVPNDITIFSANMKTNNNNVGGLFTKTIGSFFKVLAVGKVLRYFMPDVVLSVAGTNLCVIIAKYIFYRRVRIILSEHVIESIYISDSMKGIIKHVLKRLISLLYPRSELIIVPAKGILEDLSINYGISDKKIVVIPNPLDIQMIQMLSKMKPPFSFPKNNSYVIGFVGGLTKEKNVPCLLKAFTSLKNKGVSMRLVIVGDGPEKEELQHLTEELKVDSYVHFVGFQENPYMFMTHFDVLVLPSFYETFSYASIEAMACGVPVITSRWYGSEYIYKDMENCILVPIDDSVVLADAIIRVLTDKDLKDKLLKDGLELANKYDVSKIVPQYEKAIINVLEAVNS